MTGGMLGSRRRRYANSSSSAGPIRSASLYAGSTSVSDSAGGIRRSLLAVGFGPGSPFVASGG